MTQGSLIPTLFGLVRAGTAALRRPEEERPPEGLTAAPPQLRVLPTLPTLPNLPTLTQLPGTGGLPSVPLGAGGADVGGSYAQEIENLSVACVPCTRSHVSTMAMAAEEGARLAAGGDERGARGLFARVLAEAVIMEALDWSADKMARARPDDRAAITEIMPRVRDLLGRTPAAPRHVVLAWASIDEALRFARSPRATPADRQEVLRRVRLTEDCMNYAERMILAPDGLETILRGLPASQHAEARLAGPTMREARHRLVSSQYDLPSLEFIAAKLQQATVALTPPLDAAKAASLAQEYRAVRVDFDRRIMLHMAQRAGSPD